MSSRNLAAQAEIGVAAMAGRLELGIDKAADALLKQQRADGHWAFELEADATIPAEYVLLKHFLDEIDTATEAKIVRYLKDIQGAHGGWPLYHGGAFNISASVKAYYALKCCGEDVNAPHMARARKAILDFGGAAKSNVFTLIQLALFGQIPWRGVPKMPIEIMHLPRWFPFHLDKVSYWSRTVIVPLLVLMSQQPKARNPKRIDVRELFVVAPEQVSNWYNMDRKGPWAVFFRVVDRILQRVDGLFPKGLRQRAIDKAVAWTIERLNGEDGLGAIYPAMANSVMMFDVLGFPKDDPNFVIAKQSIEKLMVFKDDQAYCQPCLSPVWDTGLAAHALLEVGGEAAQRVTAATDWLKDRQILDVVGDWAVRAPGVRPGGWAFQYNNPHYPDVDDTAVVVMAMDRLDHDRYKEAIDRAVEWILGLQSKNGGWGAFDADNEYYYLNHIPFADHGALLDPPTADVSARCLSMLAQLGYKIDHPKVKAAVDYLMREQEADGAWFGRWGTNYIYGTWSVLCALNAIGIPADHPAMRKAVTFLISKQRADGGWGESGDSYWADKPRGEGPESTPSQTAWAVLGLMAAGEVDCPAVARGMAYLSDTQKTDGTWDEQEYTAVGFPRVFYLRYHGYKSFFPIWAMARYRNLKQGNAQHVMYGM
ncbi:squalene--hopene cyclase [Dongia rigui]|uniref:Squalene--hopene cyclase n=1 Tax=Dongia rigui TaxID=940149 RepID=A0ABU5E191_9PROT|nr:squalene--hopene cyclase [Dongia rigui]MDY0873366.1 squalene--hopene cyclase [Dongia rigui]